MRPDHYTPDAFDMIWDLLALAGECDERGGMEYTRCRLEWDTHGATSAARAFIRNRANIPAEVPELPDLGTGLPEL